MAKKKKKQKKAIVEKEEKKPFNLKLLLMLAGNSVIFFALYETGNYFEFYPTFWICFSLALGFSLAYFIYNRGMSRNKITPEMLPSDWSAVQKCEFIADGERRKKKSKWMLTIIIPLFFVLAFDMVRLFYLDSLKELFKG